MILGTVLVGFPIILLGFIFAALPLYFAVKVLGGKTTLLRTVLVNILGGLAVSLIQTFFRRWWGSLIAFGILIWIYREMFRLKWIKAFLAWLLELVFVALFYFVAVLLGLGTLALLQ
ncbi:hypothetical protein COY95_05280 [Candidatus Woesearchaeota archaeon CG_4_10_14_0_8_um_filter_47_5]|nr:MAG: hypothetical protein COY95_05280 [Candidatus Woesearchaeota archaeon CG_4_10_14_0_8_um_filter_47_5]